MRGENETIYAEPRMGFNEISQHFFFDWRCHGPKPLAALAHSDGGLFANPTNRRIKL